MNASPKPSADSNGPGALSCPKCKGSDIRPSNWRSGDGLLRLLLFTTYRCRDCHRRFFKVSGSALAVGGFTVLLLGSAIGGGWALREHYEPKLAEPQLMDDEPPVVEPNAAQMLDPIASQGLSQLAEQGEARAQFSLAMSYLNGSGVEKNLPLAFKWFEKAAGQGYAEGQYALGSMYLSGRGTLQNFETAYEWFLKAAQQNHAEAQYRLGLMYRNGHAVAADKVKAYVWFNLAAAQGNERAAEARDSLLPTLTSEQIARGQRESQTWKPAAAKP